MEDFIDFLNKYKGKPTDSGMEKFFKGEVMVSILEEDSCSSATRFKDSGNLDLMVDALTMLTMDDDWVLVTPYQSESMKMILISPKIPDNWLIIDDVKQFHTVGQEKNYPELITGYNSLLSLDPMGEWSKHSPGENMPPKTEWGDISVGGVWFDGDDDWNYTWLSKFLTSHVDFNDDDTKAWLIKLTNTGGALPLLNWVFSFYDSLFELVGVKV
tara:strand:+ start:400 stop:1041 length:642 start_codon:yes stop_codon:yes gene_type:complete